MASLADWLVSEEQRQLRMYDLRMQLIIEKFSEIVICDFGGHDFIQRSLNACLAR